jgi:hypothetical protein
MISLIFRERYEHHLLFIIKEIDVMVKLLKKSATHVVLKFKISTHENSILIISDFSTMVAIVPKRKILKPLLLNTRPTPEVLSKK